MEELKVVGLDLAKSVFQVHGMNAEGRKLCGKRLGRSEVVAYFAKLPPTLVGMEACGGAHHWARVLSGLGHRVKLMAPQHVKPFVHGNKTDARDAAAIAEAATRQSVPRVAVRSVEGQQMQALHRVRDLWMKQRIALGNQIRGLLSEFGEVIPQGFKRLKQDVAQWQARAGVELVTLKELVVQLMHALRELEERIHVLEVRIRQQHKGNAASRLIESIPGVGLLSATAVVASFGQCESFESARKFSCCLGLTPREHSSGGKQMLLGITKRGNGYVRKLLIHGARSVLKVRMNNAAHAEDWVVKLAKRRGHNIAAVALAAKNARRIWAMLRTGEMFRVDYAQADCART
ncbi:MAG TPA: IS110 family transposase [Rhodocyclaceae bacterium]|nr:IS110 family transposase [Rhodocyclaceae bacterium]